MRNALRPGLPPLPPRIAALPISEKGYPVPYFVAYVDGKPDFRVADGEKIIPAMKHSLCWVCGQKLGRHISFVVGPMCTVNRISGEPPSHRDCAEFSAQACPFMVYPRAERREANMPDGTRDPGGKMLTHNPGVAAIWTTRSMTVEMAGGGVVFKMGLPEAVEWYTKGRHATHEEVLEAMKAGMPHLVERAHSQDDLDNLQVMYHDALRFLPPREAPHA